MSNHSTVPADQLQILANTSVKGADWRKTYIHVLIVGETHTDTGRRCKLHRERPCPNWESSQRPSCHEAIVLTAQPPCHPATHLVQSTHFPSALLGDMQWLVSDISQKLNDLNIHTGHERILKVYPKIYSNKLEGHRSAEGWAVATNFPEMIFIKELIQIFRKFITKNNSCRGS